MISHDIYGVLECFRWVVKKNTFGIFMVSEVETGDDKKITEKSVG